MAGTRSKKRLASKASRKSPASGSKKQKGRGKTKNAFVETEAAGPDSGGDTDADDGPPVDGLLEEKPSAGGMDVQREKDAVDAAAELDQELELAARYAEVLEAQHNAEKAKLKAEQLAEEAKEQARVLAEADKKADTKADKKADGEGNGGEAVIDLANDDEQQSPADDEADDEHVLTKKIGELSDELLLKQRMLEVVAKADTGKLHDFYKPDNIKADIVSVEKAIKELQKEQSQRFPVCAKPAVGAAAAKVKIEFQCTACHKVCMSQTALLRHKKNNPEGSCADNKIETVGSKGGSGGAFINAQFSSLSDFLASPTFPTVLGARAYADLPLKVTNIMSGRRSMLAKGCPRVHCKRRFGACVHTKPTGSEYKRPEVKFEAKLECDGAHPVGCWEALQAVLLDPVTGEAAKPTLDHFEADTDFYDQLHNEVFQCTVRGNIWEKADGAQLPSITIIKMAYAEADDDDE